MCALIVLFCTPQGANILLTERGDVKLGQSSRSLVSHINKAIHSFNCILLYSSFSHSGFWSSSRNQCICCEEKVLYWYPILVSTSCHSRDFGDTKNHLWVTFNDKDVCIFAPCMLKHLNWIIKNKLFNRLNITFRMNSRNKNVSINKYTVSDYLI